MMAEARTDEAARSVGGGQDKDGRHVCTSGGSTKGRAGSAWGLRAVQHALFLGCTALLSPCTIPLHVGAALCALNQGHDRATGTPTSDSSTSITHDRDTQERGQRQQQEAGEERQQKKRQDQRQDQRQEQRQEQRQDQQQSPQELYVPQLSIPTGKDDKVVLLLGDGNFSFSLALADAIWGRCLSKAAADAFFNTNTFDLSDNLCILATSFDQRRELLEKYPETQGILSRLEHFPRVQVLHGVNAWQIQDQFPSVTFHAIVWNHPHLGVEDFRLHKFLMAHFFHSAEQCLAEDGFVSVSLVQGQAERWDITPQALKSGLHLTTLEPFDPDAWYGYQTKRNRTGQSFQNQHTQRHTNSSMRSQLLQYRRQPTAPFHPAHKQPASAPSTTTAADPATEGQEAGPSRPAQPAAGFEDKKNVEKAPPVTPQFVCSQCGRGFALRRGLKTHMRQVHELQKYGNWTPNMEKQLKCDVCGKRFHDEEARWQHNVSKHSEAPAPDPQRPLTTTDELTAPDVHYIPCPVCGQAIPDSWHIEQHLEMLKPLVGIKAVCKLCNKVFTEHRALGQHLNFCRVELPPELMVRRKRHCGRRRESGDVAAD